MTEGGWVTVGGGQLRAVMWCQAARAAPRHPRLVARLHGADLAEDLGQEAALVDAAAPGLRLKRKAARRRALAPLGHGRQLVEVARQDELAGGQAAGSGQQDEAAGTGGSSSTAGQGGTAAHAPRLWFWV